MSEEKENWDSTGMYFGIYIGVVIMCLALIGTLLWISDIEKPAGISTEKAVVTKKYFYKGENYIEYKVGNDRYFVTVGADRFEKAKKGDKADAMVVREKDVITGHINRYMDTIDHKTAFKIDDTIDANRKKSKSKLGFQKKVGLIFVTLGVIIVINFFMWDILCPPPMTLSEQEERECWWKAAAVVAVVDIVFAGVVAVIKLICRCLS